MESEVLLLLNEKYSAGFCSASEKPALFFTAQYAGLRLQERAAILPQNQLVIFHRINS
jgi:hypothetical protein